MGNNFEDGANKNGKGFIARRAAIFLFAMFAVCYMYGAAIRANNDTIGPSLAFEEFVAVGFRGEMFDYLYK